VAAAAGAVPTSIVPVTLCAERSATKYQRGYEYQRGSANQAKQAFSHCTLPNGRAHLMRVIGCHQAVAFRICPWHFTWSAFRNVKEKVSCRSEVASIRIPPPSQRHK
jgi:hypothetical protein